LEAVVVLEVAVVVLMVVEGEALMVVEGEALMVVEEIPEEVAEAPVLDVELVLDVEARRSVARLAVNTIPDDVLKGTMH
jgi:hypothetical protein